MSEVYILMKQRYASEYDQHDPPPAIVHAVYSTEDGARQRVDRIASHPDNAKYPMTETLRNHWRIGPDEREGFFGQAPMRLWILKMEVCV